MIFYVLDKNFQPIDIIDTFTEAVWNVFFRDQGDFSLYLPAYAYATNPNLKADNYIMTPDSDRYMIIEDFQTKKEIDVDPIFIVSGRSLESLLDRRVIWDKITFDAGGKVQDLIKRIVTENLVSPLIADRAIPGFTFENSVDPVVLEKVTVNTYELHGDNVLDAVKAICSNYDLGFRVLPNGAGGFKMDLYAGLDRSYQQETNPWVVFSPKYENLENTSLTIKNSTGRNAILMYNEFDYATYDDNGLTGYHEVYAEDVSGVGGVKTGLDRRELFLESSKSHIKDDVSNTPYTNAEYRSILQKEGKHELSLHEVTGAFSGKVEALRQFVLGKDFQLGDIVQVENEYGMTGRCRVAEVIYSHNDSGERIIPYFTNVGSDELMN